MLPAQIPHVAGAWLQASTGLILALTCRLIEVATASCSEPPHTSPLVARRFNTYDMPLAELVATVHTWTSVAHPLQ